MTDEDSAHEASNARLLAMLPPDQVERVLASAYCDIEPEFLGFMSIYERLAEIIPRHWTVVDLGCSYAAQAFFFCDHKSYVGVDLGGNEQFKAPNTTLIEMPIKDFLEKHLDEFNQATTFAICSYVPCDESAAMIRQSFRNVFVYYPAGMSFPVIAKAEGK